MLFGFWEQIFQCHVVAYKIQPLLFLFNVFTRMFPDISTTFPLIFRLLYKPYKQHPLRL